MLRRENERVAINADDILHFCLGRTRANLVDEGARLKVWAWNGSAGPFGAIDEILFHAVCGGEYFGCLEHERKWL